MDDGRRQLLGVRLKAARKQAGLSQANVAEALSITRQSISAWETGASGPSATQLAELSVLYCRCAHSLLFGAPFASVVVAALVPRVAATIGRRSSVQVPLRAECVDDLLKASMGTSGRPIA